MQISANLQAHDSDSETHVTAVLPDVLRAASLCIIAISALAVLAMLAAGIGQYPACEGVFDSTWAC